MLSAIDTVSTMTRIRSIAVQMVEIFARVGRHQLWWSQAHQLQQRDTENRLFLFHDQLSRLRPQPRRPIRSRSIGCIASETVLRIPIDMFYRKTARNGYSLNISFLYYLTLKTNYILKLLFGWCF